MSLRDNAIGVALLCQVLAACGVGSFAKLSSSLKGNGSGDSSATSPLNNQQRAVIEQDGGISPTGNESSEVGLLFAHNADGSVRDSCSGTLIQTVGHPAFNVVMTAKHCTDIDTFYIGNGQPLAYPSDHNWQDATADMTAYSVIDTVELDSGDVTEPVCPHPAIDIRLLRLETDVSGVTPALIGTEAPNLAQSCKFVGFGVHTDPESNQVVQMVKRSLTIPLAAIEISSYEQTNVSNGAPGIGDSGGPLYCGGFVVGTDSCGSGDVVYEQLNQSFARVDVKASMIDDVVAQWTDIKPTSAAGADGSGNTGPVTAPGTGTTTVATGTATGTAASVQTQTASGTDT